MLTIGSPRLAVLTAATALTAGLASGPAAQTDTPGQRYRAVAMDLDRGEARQLTIAVERWSSDAERDRLMETMLTRGPEFLLEALDDLPRVGFLQVDGGLSWDLHFARRIPGEDGAERVIMATDRPVSFWEAAKQPLSLQYPYTVIELHMRNGVGEGTLSLATRVIPDKEHNIVVLEDYEAQRIRLTRVTAEGR